jgi:hypothetical protein
MDNYTAIQLQERVNFLGKRVDELINDKVKLLDLVKNLEKQVAIYRNKEINKPQPPQSSKVANKRTNKFKHAFVGLNEVRHQKYSLLTS